MYFVQCVSFFGFLVVEILISKHCIIDLLLSILSRPVLLGLEFVLLAGMRELRLVVVVVVGREVFVCCTRADASVITLGVGFRRRPVGGIWPRAMSRASATASGF